MSSVPLTKIFLEFIKLGLFSFGGGLSVMGMVQRIVVEGYHILTTTDFMNIMAISEVTPGVISVNAATFVGYKLGGIGGGIVTTLCVILIPTICTLLAAMVFKRIQDNKIVKRALSGIRVIVLGIIASAIYTFAQAAFVDWWSLLFFGLSFFLVSKCKIHPALSLLICGALGAVLFELIL